jgi:hypothetical protein
MHIAGNEAQSSSVLPMLRAHEEAAPEASYVGTEDVTMERLDDVLASFDVAGPVYAKIDVQGYERQVMAGAAETLAHVRGMELELSLVPLYEGSPLWEEMIALMKSQGFELKGFFSGFTDERTGRLLQADGVFFRP